tara:strand:- start:283 stop:528 length:246 start_codon:yes stop_codon:yes gene_type:complete
MDIIFITFVVFAVLCLWGAFYWISKSHGSREKRLNQIIEEFECALVEGWKVGEAPALDSFDEFELVSSAASAASELEKIEN